MKEVGLSQQPGLWWTNLGKMIQSGLEAFGGILYSEWENTVARRDLESSNNTNCSLFYFRIRFYFHNDGVHQVEPCNRADYDSTASQSLAGSYRRALCWHVGERLLFLLARSAPTPWMRKWEEHVLNTCVCAVRVCARKACVRVRERGGVQHQGSSGEYTVYMKPRHCKFCICVIRILLVWTSNIALL